MIITYLLIAAVWFYIFVKRADILARIARASYVRGFVERSYKQFALADKIGVMSIDNSAVYGYVALRLGHLDKARSVLAKASMNPLAKERDKMRVKAMRALVFWKEGDLAAATEAMEEVISKIKNSSYYQNLGLLTVLSGDKKKALSVCLEAYDYNSDDNIIADNLAQAYALNGDFDNAKKIYETLMPKEPHFPEAYYGYGLLLCKTGDKERGLELIKKSLDMNYTFISVMQRDEVEKLYNSLIA